MIKVFALLLITTNVFAGSNADIFDCSEIYCNCGDEPTFSMKLNADFVKEAYTKTTSKLINQPVIPEEIKVYDNNQLASLVYKEHKDKFDKRLYFLEGLCYLRLKTKENHTGVNKKILGALQNGQRKCDSLWCKIKAIF